VVDGDTDKAGDRVQDRFGNLDQRGVGGCRSLYIEASRAAGVGTHHSEPASRHGCAWYVVRVCVVWCGTSALLLRASDATTSSGAHEQVQDGRIDKPPDHSIPSHPSQRQPASPPARQSCGAWYGQCTGISRTLLEDNPSPCL
jgi:hypothetical protein